MLQAPRLQSMAARGMTYESSFKKWNANSQCFPPGLCPTPWTPSKFENRLDIGINGYQNASRLEDQGARIWEGHPAVFVSQVQQIPRRFRRWALPMLRCNTRVATVFIPFNVRSEPVTQKRLSLRV